MSSPNPIKVRGCDAVHYLWKRVLCDEKWGKTVSASTHMSFALHGIFHWLFSSIGFHNSSFIIRDHVHCQRQLIFHRHIFTLLRKLCRFQDCLGSQGWNSIKLRVWNPDLGFLCAGRTSPELRTMRHSCLFSNQRTRRMSPGSLWAKAKFRSSEPAILSHRLPKVAQICHCFWEKCQTLSWPDSAF